MALTSRSSGGPGGSRRNIEQFSLNLKADRRSIGKNFRRRENSGELRKRTAGEKTVEHGDKAHFI